MEYIALKNIAKITMGQSPESSSYNDEGDGLPFYQGNADFGELYPTERVWCNEPKKVAEPNDILISVRAPIGALNYAKDKCCIGRGLAAITVEDDAERNYIFHLLKAKNADLNKQGTGSTFKAIGRSVLEELKVPRISQDEKQKCMKLMDLLETIIRERKLQISAFDNLIKARFVEMFGDPMVNPKGYGTRPYGDLFELNAGGTPSKTKPEYWENGTISWIGSNLCQNTILYENDGKYISQEGYDHSSARLFPVDTVLIALVGATIGKTALLKFETSTNQNVLGVRHIAESGYNPLFVFYYTQFLYQKFMNIGDGGFNMASKGFVSELPMYDIDLSVQNDFAIFAEQVDKSKVVVQKALDEAQLLFDSLMQEYFG